MSVEGIQVAAPQDPSSIDPFFAKDLDVLKTYAFECAAACAVSIQGPRGDDTALPHGPALLIPGS